MPKEKFSFSRVRSDFPDKKERDALLAFVRSGGWIVYAGNFPFLFVESGAVAPPSFYAGIESASMRPFRQSLLALSLKAHRKSR